MSTSQEYKKVKMNSLKNPAGLSQQSRVKTNNHETQIKHRMFKKKNRTLREIRTPTNGFGDHYATITIQECNLLVFPSSQSF